MLYELRLTPTAASTVAVPELAQRLLDLGVAPGALVEHETAGRRRLLVYLESAARARAWLRRVRLQAWRGVSLRLRKLPDAAWKDTWKRHLRPFPLTRRLRIVPAWSTEAARGPDERRIVLETGMAFGTGKHATTRWVAEFIAQLDGRFEDALDIGLGSGILAIVACRYGARRVVGVDIDREPIRVAERNLRANGCAHYRLIEADFSTLRLDDRFDLVVANIGARELLLMRERLLRAVKPGRYLAVSGITAANGPAFRRAFAHPALRCVAVRRNADWVACLYRRRARRAAPSCA